ncbi:MAG: hypothetical protein JXA39_05465 [Bacteroidales bacterium]|nr:hypothetical protein [Bacteroidales bacterium]MBN2864288.1 hypothetical protein [Bacteroidales bacterium]
MKKSLSILFLLILSGTSLIQAQQRRPGRVKYNTPDLNSSENIALATTGDNIDSQISAQSGRAPFYLIFDEKGNLLKSLKNPSLSSGGGASSIVVDLLIREGCSAVIAGQFGDKMINQLRINKIEYIQQTGVAKEVLQAFLKEKQKNK